MDSFILMPVPVDSLLIQIKEIVTDVLQEQKTIQEEDKLISPAEVCKIFEPAISLPTLASWTKNGWLISRKIGGRVFYNKKQVLEAGKTLKRFKQKTEVK